MRERQRENFSRRRRRGRRGGSSPSGTVESSPAARRGRTACRRSAPAQTRRRATRPAPSPAPAPRRPPRPGRRSGSGCTSPSAAASAGKVRGQARGAARARASSIPRPSGSTAPRLGLEAAVAEVLALDLQHLEAPESSSISAVKLFWSKRPRPSSSGTVFDVVATRTPSASAPRRKASAIFGSRCSSPTRPPPPAVARGRPRASLHPSSPMVCTSSSKLRYAEAPATRSRAPPAVRLPTPKPPSR